MNDSHWKNKFKVGHTHKITDVRNYIMSKFQTPFGKGNVVIVKIVPIFGDVMKSKKNMLARFHSRNGVVVTGDENLIKSSNF